MTPIGRDYSAGGLVLFATSPAAPFELTAAHPGIKPNGASDSSVSRRVMRRQQ